MNVINMSGSKEDGPFGSMIMKKSKCRVCNDVANLHRHFGGNLCCFACKAFFRRAVRGRPVEECKKAGGCDMDVKNRRKCGYCRYKLCLEAGMDPKWVMTNKDLEERQSLKELKTLLYGQDKKMRCELRTEYDEKLKSRSRQRLDKAVEVSITSEERALLENLMNLAEKFPIDYNSEETACMTKAMLDGSKLPDDIFESTFTKVLEKIISSIATVDQLESLQLRDQFTLLTSNLIRNCMMIKLAFEATPPAFTSGDLKILAEKAEAEHGTKQSHFQLYQIMPPKSWFKDDEHEAKLAEALQRLINLSLDHVSFHIMVFIAFLQVNQDQLPLLEDHEKIKATRLFFKNLLYKYLCTKMGKIRVNRVMQNYLGVLQFLNDIEPIRIPQ